MKTLVELRKKRQEKHARWVALAEKQALLKEGEVMPDDEVSELSVIKDQVQLLDQRISDLESAVSAMGQAATPISEGGEGGDDGEKGWAGIGVMGSDGRITPHGYGEKQQTSAILADPKKGKGFKAAQFALGVVMAKGGMGFEKAAMFTQRRFGSSDVAKALNTAGVATGGALIPQDFASELIELLRAETVIRQSGPTTIPMPLGNMTIPRLAGGATAGFQGELDDISPSQETFDDLQLNAKKLTALVPVSNDLIRRAPIGVEQIVRDDLVQTVARREDLADMLGDGSGGSVIGLLNLAAAALKITVNPFAATDNATIFNAVSATLFTLRLLLKQNMSRMIRPVWIMSPGTEAFLMGLITQFGMYAYKDEMEAGKLLGIPYKVSQQLPTNLATMNGGSTYYNGAYLFLADFADVILAETMNMMVDASDVASYKDTGGNAVSAFVRDQTAFRIIEEYDFNIRHQASVAVAVLPGWLPAGYTGVAGASYYVQAASGDMSAAASTWGSAAPTGSNNPANVSAVVPGGTLPGRP